jgi:hypothetical protein
MSTPALPIEQIPLPHLPRELAQIVEPGQDIPGHRRLYHEIGLGELPMIVFIRGRWYCPRPELPALAQQGYRISDLCEDFGEVFVLPSGALDLDAQGAL